MRVTPSQAASAQQALAALLDDVALRLCSAASLVLLAASLLQVGWCTQVSAPGGAGAFEANPTSIVLPIAPCSTAVEVDGILHCDADDLPFRGRVEIGRRVDARGATVEGDGWLSEAAFSALALPVDVARADVARLSSLPGIGPSRAAAITAARPLASLDALLQVQGIGPATLAQLKVRARLGPSWRSSTR